MTPHWDARPAACFSIFPCCSCRQASGVIDHLHLLETYGPVLFLALFISTALSLAVTGLIFTAVKRRQSARKTS